ncbi:MAG: hypothetical protein HBSAPP03_28670 [Phycisphaerae bacterium]|nr:MAG: hypothetical protein HBSAPP03_28670 [Phycisphaerae bacterium]
MDERQTQIRERAGLEESRLNVEFIDWLRKWGSPLLLVAALAAGAVWAKEKYGKTTRDKADGAFLAFEQARGTGQNVSPDSLVAVANEYGGTRAVGELARLEAADAYLDGVRRGLKVGAVMKTGPEAKPGELENPDDVLTAQDRADYLARAGELYQAVLTASDGKPERMLLALNALYGLAAVAEGRGEFDAARAWYEKIAARTEGTTFDAHAKVAKKRIAGLDGLKALAPLPSFDQVPKLPEPAPAAIPATPIEPAPGEPVAPTPAPPSEPTDTPPPTPAPGDAPK